MTGRQVIKQPYIPYEKINGGFEVSIKGGKNIVTFEKEGGFTKKVFRDIIRERYKNGQLLKMCQTCENTCKQVEMKGVKFECRQKKDRRNNETI